MVIKPNKLFIFVFVFLFGTVGTLLPILIANIFNQPLFYIFPFVCIFFIFILLKATLNSKLVYKNNIFSSFRGKESIDEVHVENINSIVRYHWIEKGNSNHINFSEIHFLDEHDNFVLSFDYYMYPTSKVDSLMFKLHSDNPKIVLKKINQRPKKTY